jgi:small GTP-binding protein
VTNSRGLLNDRDSALRSRARSAIEDLRAELSGFGAAKDDLDVLRQAARDLDELFMLVVVGEFNAGKSALINALLGADLLEEGVTPTTTAINILRYGSATAQRWLGPQLLEREFDEPLLRDVAVVDTPGTNAILREHQELTEQFVPRSDLVLFVTSVERPFTESERAFLEAIRGWGKKTILVINKIDLLRQESELRQVTGFVGENVQSLLGFRPQIFPVSARRARELQGRGDADFARLQRFITDTLTAENRVKLKISSPLGVAGRVAEKYEATAHARLDLLAEDSRTGESLETQLRYYQEDLRSQLSARLHEVENIVFELSERADRFFDETFRLARVFDLINTEKVRGDFERQVVANTAERIDHSVDSIAKWVVDREIQLWQGVVDELSRRRQASPDGVIVGEMGGNFEASRRDLIQNVSRTARRVVAGYDRDAEARALGDTMREAVAHTALAEASAVGLGALVVFLIGTAAADITGILAGTLVAGLGLYIIPARKNSVQKKFRQRADDLRMELKDSLTRQLNSELAASVERLQTAIAPYLRFVRSEQDKVSAFQDRVVQLRNEMGALNREIGSPSFEA